VSQLTFIISILNIICIFCPTLFAYIIKYLSILIFIVAKANLFFFSLFLDFLYLGLPSYFLNLRSFLIKFAINLAILGFTISTSINIFSGFYRVSSSKLSSFNNSSSSLVLVLSISLTFINSSFSSLSYLIIP
jgi:hypothetical protein